jgi:hypothetical protein
MREVPNCHPVRDLTLGVGETFAAISLLIAVIAREKAQLPVHLIPDLMRWLDIPPAHPHRADRQTSAAGLNIRLRRATPVI